MKHVFCIVTGLIAAGAVDFALHHPWAWSIYAGCAAANWMNRLASDEN